MKLVVSEELTYEGIQLLRICRFYFKRIVVQNTLNCFKKNSFTFIGGPYSAFNTIQRGLLRERSVFKESVETIESIRNLLVHYNTKHVIV